MPQNKPKEQNTQQPEEQAEGTEAVKAEKSLGRKITERLGIQKTKKPMEEEVVEAVHKESDKGINILKSQSSEISEKDFADYRKTLSYLISDSICPNGKKLANLLDEGLEHSYGKNADVKAGGNSHMFLANYRDLGKETDELGELLSDEKFGKMKQADILPKLATKIKEIIKTLNTLKALQSKIEKDTYATFNPVINDLGKLLDAYLALLKGPEKDVNELISILKKPEQSISGEVGASGDSDDKKSGDKKAEEKAKK